MTRKNRNYSAEALSVAVQMGWEGGRTLPVLLEAVPGCGKTQFMSMLGRELLDVLIARKVSDSFYVDINILPQTMPETLEGIPAPVTDVNGKDYLLRLALRGIRRLQESKFGIWVGDEVTSASLATGAAAMGLVQDGRAGDETLEETTGRVLICNPSWCAAGSARDFTAPEINRVMKLTWKLPLHDFLDYMRGGKGLGNHVRILPEGWEREHTALATTLITSYLKNNPTHMNTLESKVTTEAQLGEPWASQRMWKNLVRALAACFSLGEEPSSQLCYVMIEGCVGEGVAKSLMTYIREYDLPSPAEIYRAAFKKDATPESIRAVIPDRVWKRPDKTRLMLEAVAVYAGQADEKDRNKYWMKAFDILEPVLDHKPDNAMSAATILMENKPIGVEPPKIAVKLFAARRKAGLSKRR